MPGWGGATATDSPPSPSVWVCGRDGPQHLELLLARAPHEVVVADHLHRKGGGWLNAFLPTQQPPPLPTLIAT